MPRAIDHSNLLAKPDAKETLCADLDRLAALQDIFYADRRFALLLIFQGMDAAGKDGAIRHVMSGPNAAGSQSSTGRTTKNSPSSGSTEPSSNGSKRSGSRIQA